MRLNVTEIMANEQNACILLRLLRRIYAAASGMIPQYIRAHTIFVVGVNSSSQE